MPALSQNSRAVHLLLISFVAGIVVSPMAVFGYPIGHDSAIHLESWMDASQQFHQGILYPQWASEANHGFGEPRFIFYPPSSWTLGGILGLLLPWKAVPAAFVWLSVMIAGVCMRTLAGEFLPPSAALIAALAYALNPYLLTTAYTRAAYAELLASAAFPLLLWGVFRMQRDLAKGFAIVVLALAAIWLTNLPGAVITTYAFALVLLTVSVSLRSMQPLFYGSAAALMALGLAAFVLFPAVWEQQWVCIDAVVNSKQLPLANFLFSPNGVPSLYSFNHHLSQLAVLLILGALASAIAARRIRHQAPAVWWSLTILCILSGILMFSASAGVWRLLPKLRMVQYPWRWLFPLCSAASLLASFAILASRRKRILLPVLGFVFVATDIIVVKANDLHPNFVKEIVEKFHSERRYLGLPEYTPLAAKGRLFPFDAPLIAPTATFSQQFLTAQLVRSELWLPERKVIYANLPHPMIVNLKLLAYPAWRASMNGEPWALQSNPLTGQLMMMLPAGTSRTEIKFAETWDRVVGKRISIGSCLLLIALWCSALWRKSRARPHELDGARANAS